MYSPRMIRGARARIASFPTVPGMSPAFAGRRPGQLPWRRIALRGGLCALWRVTAAARRREEEGQGERAPDH
jgi:hypothetical protein